MIPRYLYIFMAMVLYSSVYATEERLSLFPLKNYDQKTQTWIKHSDKDYDQSLLPQAMQKRHLDQFYKKYFAPWDKKYIERIIKANYPDDMHTIENEYINFFSNKKKSYELFGYGQNYRPHTESWITAIQRNMHMEQFKGIVFHPEHRAIAVENLLARALPTDDVHYYSYQQAGQGYPFDNLQMSAVWVGTPLYIIGESRDRAWVLVLTPDYIAWVKSSGVARVRASFIKTWVQQSLRHLAALTQTESVIIDDNKNFVFKAYVGMVFPAINRGHDLRLLIPIKNQQQAMIKYVTVKKDKAAILPMHLTPHNMAKIIKTLQNRPYGWGNMSFYNDCSSELKSLLTPFGIWLPRNSSEQIKVGRKVDVSELTPEKRLAYLKKHGKKFITIVYIKGHVFLYIGNYKNPHQSHEMMAMTYQNVWGLKPAAEDRRAVIGQSVFFPLLLQYPEDRTLASQASRKYFKITFLDEPANYVKFPKKMDLLNILDR